MMPRRKFAARVAIAMLATPAVLPTAFAIMESVANAQILEDALRSVGTDRCLAEATRLQQGISTSGPWYCHLRRAGIDAADTIAIAKAMESFSFDAVSSLVSFSQSYNRAVGDAAASALTTAFLASLRELGLVDCGIGDVGGIALLQWARKAPRLQMICVDGNAFSDSVTRQFNQLGSRQLSVFV